MEDRKLIVSIIKGAVEAGARKKRACEELGIPIRTIQRWEKIREDRRKNAIHSPKNKLTQEEVDKIIYTVSLERFRDKSPKEIVPVLAEEGIYIASESSMYRILREKRMVLHRENTREPKKRHKPKELLATGPNQVWSWDITYIKTAVKGLFYYLYLFMDIWDRKIVCWDIFEEQTSENARSTILKVSDEVNLKEIALHSDNGSPMKGATFLATLSWLGVVPSFSRPACSNDNPYSESLFKTIKYRTSFPKAFKSTVEAKKWMESFVCWYNNEHRHSGINYVTPNQRHNGLDKKILKTRTETYRTAMLKNPARWIKGKCRNWSYENDAVLNPNTEISNKVA